MLSAKQNFLETIKRGGKPDRIVKQFEGTAFLPGDPVPCLFAGCVMPDASDEG
jgi:hypothetical protein